MMIPGRFRGGSGEALAREICRPVRDEAVGERTGSYTGRRKDGSEFPIEIGLNTINTLAEIL